MRLDQAEDIRRAIDEYRESQDRAYEPLAETTAIAFLLERIDDILGRKNETTD